MEQLAMMSEAAEVVERIAHGGRFINVTVEANRLLEKHAQSRVLAFALESEIVRLASKRGIVILFAKT